ncbi:MAG: DsbA family protein [Sedimenticola sp.]|nr:DsbA family protein [Sedimenticola sp.]
MKQWLLIAILAAGLILTGCDNSSEIPRPAAPEQTSQAQPTSTDSLEGKYKLLSSPLPDQDLAEGKPYLVEFFWFGCPHCYSLEPLASAFKQKHPDFQFVTMPAAPNKRWEIEARIYYAMEALGVRDSHYDQVFKLYADKRNEKRYPTLDEVAALFSNAGVSRSDLEQSMNSGPVSEKIALSQRLFDQAELTGVPSLIINGKYQLDFNGLDDENFAQDFMQTIIDLGKR